MQYSLIGNSRPVKYRFSEFIFVSSPLNKFIIRITFSRPPNLSDSFNIFARYWLLDYKSRALLQRNNVITKYNVYNNGECNGYYTNVLI